MSRKGKPNFVYGRIFEAISNGEFPLEGRLPSENELAHTYDVSRPTVRQALEFLKEDGIIHSVQGSGNYVKFVPRLDDGFNFSFDRLSDLLRCFEFRATIEKDAAYFSANRATVRDIDGIRNIIEEMDRTIGNGISEELDLAFHEQIVASSKNDFYLRAYRTLVEPLRSGMRIARQNSLVRPKDYLLQVQEEHRAIFLAIEAKKPDAARDAMTYHLTNLRDRLFDGIQLSS